MFIDTPVGKLTRNMTKHKLRNVGSYMKPLKSLPYRSIIAKRYKENIGYDGPRFTDRRRHALWEAVSCGIEHWEGIHANAAKGITTAIEQMQAISCKLEDDLDDPYLEKHASVCGRKCDFFA